jgi:DNA-binding transcriptional LysR family regulator
VQLFRRKARGVELTDAGRAFLDNARAMLAHFDQTFETTRRIARGELGQICVGVTPMSWFHPFVPRAIRTFRDSFPGVSVRLQEVIGNDLAELRNGRIDVVFTRSPVAHPDGLVVSSLLEEPLMLALPSEHELAGTNRDGGPAISLKRLAQETFIVYGPPGSGLIEATTAACHAAGFNPRVGQAAPRVTSMIGLVASGLGISLVPASLRHLHVDGMVYRRLKGSPQPKAILDLVSRRGDPSAVIRHFLQLVKRAAKSVVQADPGRRTRRAKMR